MRIRANCSQHNSCGLTAACCTASNRPRPMPSQHIHDHYKYMVWFSPFMCRLIALLTSNTVVGVVGEWVCCVLWWCVVPHRPFVELGFGARWWRPPRGDANDRIEARVYRDGRVEVRLADLIRPKPLCARGHFLSGLSIVGRVHYILEPHACVYFRHLRVFAHVPTRVRVSARAHARTH
jgi:hypothetical protein